MSAIVLVLQTAIMATEPTPLEEMLSKIIGDLHAMNTATPSSLLAAVHGLALVVADTRRLLGRPIPGWQEDPDRTQPGKRTADVPRDRAERIARRRAEAGLRADPMTEAEDAIRDKDRAELARALSELEKTRASLDRLRVGVRMALNLEDLNGRYDDVGDADLMHRVAELRRQQDSLAWPVEALRGALEKTGAPVADVGPSDAHSRAVLHRAAARLRVLAEEHQCERKEADRLRTGLAEAQAERDQLLTRRDELLALVAKISQSTPLPEELVGWEGQRASLVAEVGSWRARLAEAERVQARMLDDLRDWVAERDRADAKIERLTAALNAEREQTGRREAREQAVLQAALAWASAERAVGENPRAPDLFSAVAAWSDAVATEAAAEESHT